MDSGTVRVGSWVTVRDGGLEEAYRVVPVEDADALRRLISEASPLGRALLGHQAGEQVRVQAPGGRRPVEIISVAS